MEPQDVFPSRGARMKKRLWLPILFLVWLAASLLLKCDCKCDCCTPDVQVKPTRETGQIQIEVGGLGVLFQGETVYETITYSGCLLEPAHTGRGQSDFQFHRTVEITSGSFQAPIQHRRNLKPGLWEVTVNCRGWQASARGTVAKNQATRFIFTFNRSGGMVK